MAAITATRAAALAVMLGLALLQGCAEGGDYASAEGDDGSTAALGALVGASVIAAGGDAEAAASIMPAAAPAEAYAPAGMAPEQVAWCSQQAQQMQVDSQSWGGSVQEVSARLGQMQRELFQGPCAGHPEAGAYLAGADRMIADGQQVVPQAEQQVAGLAGGVVPDLTRPRPAAGGDGGEGGSCPEEDAIARRMDEAVKRSSSVVHQMEAAMWGFEHMLALSCLTPQQRAELQSTLETTTRTCNQTASRTCMAQLH